MKRLALLVASVAAITLFTACNDTDEDLYYSEDIALNYKFLNGNDTTFHFTQEFTKAGNAIIYPSSSVNREEPYIDFQYGYTCVIVHDSIFYPNRLVAKFFRYTLFPPIKAKIDYAAKKSKDFSFQYILHQDGDFVISAKHTCHRIERLSD